MAPHVGQGDIGPADVKQLQQRILVEDGGELCARDPGPEERGKVGGPQHGDLRTAVPQWQNHPVRTELPQDDHVHHPHHHPIGIAGHRLGRLIHPALSATA
ncbi:hypothetical protein ABZ543_27460 [Streptomyces roseifaciens]